MATERELKKRIRSVQNIGQVTRALEAVSASKVRKAQAQVLATRAYALKAWEVLTKLSAPINGVSAMHPLLKVPDEVKSAAIVLFTSDRGLCGAFNTHIVRKTTQFVSASGWDTRIVSVGRRGRDQMYRMGYQVSAEFSSLPDVLSILDATPIARTVIDDFLTGQVDVVYLAYMDFVNTLVQRPVVKRLLPLTPQHTEDQAMAEYIEAGPEVIAGRLEYVYEPNPTTILNEVVPRFTELQVFQAMLESVASEHSARMVAMRNATDNASILVDDLTLARNKARQTAITSELLDIAGGAEALAQARAGR